MIAYLYPDCSDIPKVIQEKVTLKHCLLRYFHVKMRCPARILHHFHSDIAVSQEWDCWMHSKSWRIIKLHSFHLLPDCSAETAGISNSRSGHEAWVPLSSDGKDVLFLIFSLATTCRDTCAQAVNQQRGLGNHDGNWDFQLNISLRSFSLGEDNTISSKLTLLCFLSCRCWSSDW